MKKAITLSIVTIVVSIATAAYHYLVQPSTPAYHGGFIRSVNPGFIRSQRSYLLPHPGYYVAGWNDSSVYLAHKKDIGHLLSIQTAQGHTSPIRLKLPPLDYYDARVSVIGDRFYLADGNIPFLYIGNMNSQNGRLIDSLPPFMQFLPLSPHTGALLFATDFENKFLTVNYDSGKKHVHTGTLTPQQDRFFSTYGHLSSDPESGLLAYVYTYRNQVVVMDSSFHPLRHLNTIDTNTTAKISVTMTDGNRKAVMSSPPFIVNRMSDLHRNRLFVMSHITASNERPLLHEKTSAIDVYDTAGNGYLFSFYLKTHAGQKARSFTLLSDYRIAVIYGQELIIYRYAAL